MARRIRAREVLGLRSVNGLSQNAIARTAHVLKLSVQDCARSVRSRYVRQSDLEDLWLESRERSGGERKLVRKYGAFGLLVVDEWLLDRETPSSGPCC